MTKIVKKEGLKLAKRKISDYLVFILFAGLVILSLFPFVFMVLTSFTQNRVMSTNFKFAEMSLQNYVSLFKNFDFSTYLVNSIIVVTCACVLNCIIASLAGYAFAKMDFPLKETIFWMYLITLMVPGQVILVPVFNIMKGLKLLNTHPALFLGIIDAFGVFLIRQFMQGIPDELIEAAKIDGCNELKIFTSIIVPLTKPVLVSLAVFTFITSWNDFIWPLILITENKMNTLTLALSTLQGNYGTNYGLVMAGATLAFLPPFILYIFLQKQFVEGIALSGIKG